MFCSKCNQLNTDDSTFCSKCGASLNEETVNTEPTFNASNNNYYRPIDNPSHFAGVVSCCFPMVGFILYFLWKDEKPNSSKLICKWMIAGVVTYVLLYIIFLIIGFAGASSLANPYNFY